MTFGTFEIVDLSPLLPQHLSKNQKWRTPKPIIDVARDIMGSIDLDPASSIDANEMIKAGKIFTIEDNGLAQSWKGYGNVWLNPPYGKVLVNGKKRSSKMIWLGKLIAEFGAGNIKRAMFLTTASTGEKWFDMIWQHANLVCFPRRIKFEGTSSSNPGSSVIAYFDWAIDPEYDESVDVKIVGKFSKLGTIVTSWERKT